MIPVGRAHIRTRTTGRGEKRYQVRYRRGGGAYPLISAGTFKTMAEARTRHALVAQELAAGRDPAIALHHAPGKPRTLADVLAEFTASRIDVSASTLARYQSAAKRLGTLGTMLPDAIRASDVQVWVSGLDASPGTVRGWLSVVRQVLDFAEVYPNPGRSSLVRLPKLAHDEIAPPSTDEWKAALEWVPERYRLVLRLIECIGIRASEAVTLTYGDVDFANERIRVSKARTKTASGQRWLRVPSELMDEVAALVPYEDRHRDRRVFPYHRSLVWKVLERAWADAGLAHYRVHDLRHRRVSLWIQQGIDVLTASVWAGHSSTQMTLNKYAHVLVSGNDEWGAFWRGVYREERMPASSEAPVMPGDETDGKVPANRHNATVRQ